MPCECNCDCKCHETIPNDAPLFTLNGFETIAKCIDVYDGDTVKVIFKYNSEYYKFRIRLLDINAPEMRKEDRPKGILARDKLRSLILDHLVKVKCENFDSFGRILGRIFIDDIDVSITMMESGLVAVSKYKK